MCECVHMRMDERVCVSVRMSVSRREDGWMGEGQMCVKKVCASCVSE